MKKVYYLLSMLLVLSLGINYMAAQTIGQQTLSKKEIRKARRQAHEKFMEQQNQLAFEQAVQALKEQSFVVEVDQLIFPRGMTKFVSSMTNFVSVNDGDAVLQITTSNFNPGPNGIGGVTVDGNISGMKTETDKDGNIHCSFGIQGVGISAEVFVTLYYGSNEANVTVSPNFNSNTLSMSGEMVSIDDSTIFKGYAY